MTDPIIQHNLICVYIICIVGREHSPDGCLLQGRGGNCRNASVTSNYRREQGISLPDCINFATPLHQFRNTVIREAPHP